MEQTAEEVSNSQWFEQLNQYEPTTWPTKERDVTAQRMLTYSIAHSYRQLEAMIAPAEAMSGDETKRRLYLTQISSMQGWYHTAQALRTFMKVAPQEAERYAKDIWLAAEAGDSYGEFLWEWAIENDVPVPTDTLGGKTQSERKELLERDNRLES
jgi:hypothetical protein